MMNITRIVSHLLIVNILMFFGTQIFLQEIFVPPAYANFPTGGRIALAFWYPFGEGSLFQPFQIVTHMFMHGDFTHLLFNMFAVFMFGPHIERVWGQKRFFFFYMFAGFGALLTHFLVSYLEFTYLGGGYPPPILGASGAVFGILVGFAYLYPNMQIMLLIPPIPIRAKYFVLIYAGIELFLGLGSTNDGVAHFAHLGGALFGYLLILYWRKYGSRLN
jgi:membrane associated rhomboid family serine protease